MIGSKSREGYQLYLSLLLLPCDIAMQQRYQCIVFEKHSWPRSCFKPQSLHLQHRLSAQSSLGRAHNCYSFAPWMRLLRPQLPMRSLQILAIPCEPNLSGYSSSCCSELPWSQRSTLRGSSSRSSVPGPCLCKCLLSSSSSVCVALSLYAPPDYGRCPAMIILRICIIWLR
jgi:hypothetical protein